MILHRFAKMRQSLILRIFFVPRGTKVKEMLILKQNTKFLWMYVGILFSFALILIVFAGLSRNNENAQELGMKDDITSLSQQNTDLTQQNATLKTTVDDYAAQIEELKKKNESYALSDANVEADAALDSAVEAYNLGNKEECLNILNGIDTSNFAESRLWTYQKLIESCKNAK